MSTALLVVEGLVLLGLPLLGLLEQQSDDASPEPEPVPVRVTLPPQRGRRS